MENIEAVTTFFGWMTAINLGLLVFSTIMLVLCRGFVGGVHGRLFRMDEAELSSTYFKFLANYKVFFLVFNLVPYIALKIMA